jgi:acetyl/propionyl-CoA carboxylase alpha subunit
MRNVYILSSFAFAISKLAVSGDCQDRCEDVSQEVYQECPIDGTEAAACFLTGQVLHDNCIRNCSAADQDAADTSAAQAAVQSLQADASDVSTLAGQAVQNIQQQDSQPSADDIAAMAAFQQLQRNASNFAASTPDKSSESSDESDQDHADAPRQAFQQALDQTNALMYQQSKQIPLSTPTKGPQLKKAQSNTSPASYAPPCHPDPGSDYCVIK